MLPVVVFDTPCHTDRPSSANRSRRNLASNSNLEKLRPPQGEQELPHPTQGYKFFGLLFWHAFFFFSLSKLFLKPTNIRVPSIDSKAPRVLTLRHGVQTRRQAENLGRHRHLMRILHLRARRLVATSSLERQSRQLTVPQWPSGREVWPSWPMLSTTLVQDSRIGTQNRSLHLLMGRPKC